MRSFSCKTIAALCVATVIGGCAAIPPQIGGDARPLADGFGRLYVLRQQQTLYSALPVTVSVDNAIIGTLASGTYRSADLPVGTKSLAVSALLSRLTTHFELPSSKTVYLLVTMEPSGSPPPRGAIGAAPAYRMLDEQGLFSIQFLEEQSATAALANLKPAP